MLTIDWSKHRVWAASQIKAEMALEDGAAWGSLIEQETRRRIQLSIATYAYEIADRPIMSDHDWDRLAQLVNPRLGTCHPVVDEFFAHQFSPMTGLWIHDHPELERVRTMFTRYYSGAIGEAYDRVNRRRAAA